MVYFILSGKYLSVYYSRYKILLEFTNPYQTCTVHSMYVHVVHMYQGGRKDFKSTKAMCVFIMPCVCVQKVLSSFIKLLPWCK